jgi:hypothetical protein
VLVSPAADVRLVDRRSSKLQNRPGGWERQVAYAAIFASARAAFSGNAYVGTVSSSTRSGTGGRPSVMTHARIGLASPPCARAARMPSRIAFKISSDRDVSTGVKMTMTASVSSAVAATSIVCRYSSGPADATISTGLRTLAVEEKPAEPGARGRRELGNGQARRHARVDGHDARSAGVRDDRHAAALR